MVLFIQTIFISKNTSVTLGNHFEKIINKGITPGRYSSASEVIRAGLRLIEQEESKIELLRNAIEEGEKSGLVTNFNSKLHLENLKKRHSKWNSVMPLVNAK